MAWWLVRDLVTHVDWIADLHDSVAVYVVGALKNVSDSHSRTIGPLVSGQWD